MDHLMEPDHQVNTSLNTSNGQIFNIDSNQSYYPMSMDDDLVLTVSHLLYWIYMPICCIIGFTGNCMVWILIRSNRILRKLPSNTYLLAMATSSSIFLCSLFLFWLELVTKTQIYSQNTIACKVQNFLAHFCDFCSVWLIVLVCLERCILLQKARHATTLSLAKCHVLVLCLTAFLFNSWILVVAKSETDPRTGLKYCDIYPHFEIVYTIFNTVETVCCIAVPSLFIIASNVFVIIKLESHLKRIPSSPTVSFNECPMADNDDTNQFAQNDQNDQKISNVHTAGVYRQKKQKQSQIRNRGQKTLISGQAKSMLVAGSSRQNAKTWKKAVPRSVTVAGNNNTHYSVNSRYSTSQAMKSAIKHKRGSLRFTDLQLTRSLLIVTTVFICLNLPNYIFRLVKSLVPEGDNNNNGIQAEKEQLLSIAVHTLLYTHHAVLFYLYIFYSPQMKKRLAPTAAKLLECYCFKTGEKMAEITGL